MERKAKKGCAFVCWPHPVSGQMRYVTHSGHLTPNGLCAFDFPLREAKRMVNTLAAAGYPNVHRCSRLQSSGNVEGSERGAAS